MSVLKKKELVTIITPIPGFIPRQLAIDILHAHSEVITLNPLVLDHVAIKAPRDAASDEYYSTWYEITERIQYIPGFGKMGSGKIAFKACFHDMPWGLQAHIYAPMSTDLRYKYRIAGNQPGIELPETMEMGLAALGAPVDGLYLREDVEVKCSIAVMSFVKSQLKAASKKMVERIIKKAELVDAGVLHAMLDNGRLRTINPADRSKPLPVSPARSPSLHDRSLPSPRASSSGNSGSPSLPYQVPRPQSLAPSYMSRPDSAGVNQAGPASPYGSYRGYSAYANPNPNYDYQSFASPQHLPPTFAQFPQNPLNMHPQQPGWGFTHTTASPAPAPAPAPVALPAEMPGDCYHAPTTKPPASSAESTPRSNRESDILSTGKWSVPTEYTQPPSQRNSPTLSRSPPGSASSDGGSRGGIDKSATELSTHLETQEEHRAETLKRLECSGRYFVPR